MLALSMATQWFSSRSYGLEGTCGPSHSMNVVAVAAAAERYNAADYMTARLQEQRLSGLHVGRWGSPS
jgi:hypothetical protein